MESSKSKKQMPQLWYWSQPDNGFSFEDVKQLRKNPCLKQKITIAGLTIVTFILHLVESISYLFVSCPVPRLLQPPH